MRRAACLTLVMVDDVVGRKGMVEAGLKKILGSQGCAGKISLFAIDMWCREAFWAGRC